LIRKFNYTGRKKINRESISLGLLGNGPERRFTCLVKLDDYKFPPKARVFVEAYYATEVKRFDFQTADNPKEPSDTTLKEFSSFPVIYFRLLVVDDHSGRQLILGAADKLSTYPSGKRPLLPLQIINSMKQEWKIIFVNDRPVVALNGNIIGALERIKTDPQLRYSILPAALREVLMQFVFVEEVDDDPDEDDDWYDWRKFCFDIAVPAAGVTLEKSDPSFSGSNVRDWIDEVVERFSHSNGFLRAVTEEGL
jgi:hypothetical protein